MGCETTYYILIFGKRIPLAMMVETNINTKGRSRTAAISAVSPWTN
jgi:hypothetical protein